MPAHTPTPTPAPTPSAPPMIATTPTSPRPRPLRRAGWIVTAPAAAFLLLDALGKLLRPEPVVEGTLRLGFAEPVILPLGLVLLASTLLWLAPRTAALGAILLTGYLGGAVATHVRVGAPLLTHVLFPVYMGALVWLGLCLRDPAVRAAVLRLAGRAGGPTPAPIP